MILKAKSIEVELNKKTSSGPEEFIHMAKSLPLVDLEVKNTAFIFVSPKQLHNCIYLGEISPYVRYS